MRSETAVRHAVGGVAQGRPPGVRPEDMVTTQHVEPPRDPQEGRDSGTDFMLRQAGVLWDPRPQHQTSTTLRVR